MLECNLQGALESQGTQGDCRGRKKTNIKQSMVYYSPAEEGIRLRAIFLSSAGCKTNLTMLQLPYSVKSAWRKV